MDGKRIDHIRGKKFPFTPADLIVLLVAAAFAVIAVVLALRAEPGDRVQITCGDEVTVLPLSRDTVISVGGLKVEIADGECRVTESTCGNLVCVHTGSIKRVGESIVCAPLGVVITVIGESDLAATVGG